MKTFHVARSIEAPIDLVFQTIASPENYQQAVPQIVKVEFLSDQRQGLGTRFRETRVMFGREESVELEVVEYIENELIRMVTDTGGTVWDTVFTLSQDAGKVLLDMKMDAKPRTLMARLTGPFIGGMVLKGVTADMDVVKTFCESQG